MDGPWDNFVQWTWWRESFDILAIAYHVSRFEIRFTTALVGSAQCQLWGFYQRVFHLLVFTAGRGNRKPSTTCRLDTDANTELRGLVQFCDSNSTPTRSERFSLVIQQVLTLPAANPSGCCCSTRLVRAGVIMPEPLK